MGWLKRWVGQWGWRWLGYQLEQPTAAPYTRYGRVLSTASDRLFGFQEGEWKCEISSGAVILLRQSSDDYVRFRVPDTNCPPLPQPDTPLDSGQADVAEPNRWQTAGTPNTTDKWLLKQESDQIQLAYPCYSGDFELEFEATDIAIISGTANGVWFDGIVVELKVDDNNWARVGFGLLADNTLRGYGYQYSVNGNVSQAIGPGVITNEVFRARVTRTGSNWSARFWRSGDPNWTTPVNLGSIGSGQVAVRLMGLRFHIVPGSSTRNVQVRYRYVQTNSGAPSSIVVTTPVVDVGQPLRVQPSVHPGVQLEWRASNSLFLPGDANPPWNNPDGSFRYWQVRASTTDIATLIERIELISDAVPLLVWRRFRSYWQLHQTGKGRVTRGQFRTVFGSGHQQRTGTNEWTQTNDEERNVGDV